MLTPVVPSSEYMNLKFTASDNYYGSYSYYKTILIDSPPVSKVSYVTIQCSVMKMCSYSIEGLFYDPNGDYLTY